MVVLPRGHSCNEHSIALTEELRDGWWHMCARLHLRTVGEAAHSDRHLERQTGMLSKLLASINGIAGDCAAIRKESFHAATKLPAVIRRHPFGVREQQNIMDEANDRYPIGLCNLAKTWHVTA